MSISQPDPASPAQVADATFSTGRRGFDQAEVRGFLTTVAAELTRLHERQAVLERELDEARANEDLSTARLDDEALTRLLGEETARILNAARESSNEIRHKAEHAAAQMLLEATDESSRVREEAETEASRRRSDAATDAESELSMAKQQGREMVNEARAYRERVLSELARRRELAREQIEQLVHGRDRLMQSFERARLVAVDVVAEMQPLGEPDEYVNLQPSTGPVPVMVAREASIERVEEESSPPSDVALYDHTADEADIAVSESEIMSVDVDRSEVEESSDSPDDAPAADADVEADAETESASSQVDGDAVSEHDDIVDGTDVDDLPDMTPGEGAVVVDPITDPASGVEEVDDGESAADPDDGSVDDVVVDLFARLRAADDDDSEDDADEDADTAGPDDSIVATTIAVEIGDVDAAADESDDELAEYEPTVFEQRDSDLTPLIVASARKLKRVLADEQNEVLDALRRSDPVRNLDGLLPWSNHHAERYSGVIADELLAAANAGATLSGGSSTAKLRSAAGKQAVQQAAETITRGLVGPLRERLERCIADGDGDNPMITKKVRSVYREVKTQHIDEQLDDVFRAAHGRGVLASFELDMPVVWTPDPSHDACPDCDDNRLEGPVAAGQPFPTGHLCTPAHPGCRCILVAAAR